MALMIKSVICPPVGGGRLQAAIFMSGEGSNAAHLLEQWTPELRWEPAVIVTDRPGTSRASILAEHYGVPFIDHNIRQFYLDRGETKVSLASENGRRIREEWTDALRSKLQPFKIDFGILAGFVPLCNITADFPCLNVHPGDLTCQKDGRRYLVGLHQIPIERALLAGLPYLRSSVILAQPYTGGGNDEMDSGPLLGISAPMTVDLDNHSITELQKLAEVRPSSKPAEGYGDTLELLARIHQEKLKESGDWIVFPAAIRDFAAGKFGLDEQGALFYLEASGWTPINTVEYHADGTMKLFHTSNRQ